MALARALTQMRERARRHRLRPARDKVVLGEDGLPGAHGEARAQGQPPPDRGVHARRQRGGGAVLPGRGAALRLPLPRRAGRGEAGGLRRAGAGATASSCASRTAISSQGAERLHRAAGGPPRAARAQPAAAALDDAGGLLGRERGPLRPGRRALPALHLAHPPLPGPAGAPAAQGALGARGQAALRSASWSARTERLEDDGRAVLRARARGDAGGARGGRLLRRRC